MRSECWPPFLYGCRQRNGPYMAIFRLWGGAGRGSSLSSMPCRVRIRDRQRVAVVCDRACQLSREGELFFLGKVKVRHAADMVPRPGRMNLRVRCGPVADRWAVFASVALWRGHP